MIHRQTARRPASLKATLIGAAVALAGIMSSPGGVAAAIRPSARSATPATTITESQAEQIGTDAYTYGIPLMEFVRQRTTQTSVTVPNTLSDAPINQLGSARQLATAEHQVFVQPNVDTLYTMGHLDLSRGPLVLHVPAVPDHRYYVFEFLDPYTNVFHYVGTRTTGDGAGSYVITGPSFHGPLPRGLGHVSSLYQHIWLAGRTLDYGPNDLPSVHRIQDGYQLIPLSQYIKHGLSWRPPRPRRVITNHTTFVIAKGIEFFDQLGTALAENPPPRSDAPILRELRTVGIGPGLHPSSEHLSAAVRMGLTVAGNGGPSHIFALRPKVAGKSVVAHRGWFVPYADTGNWGTDYEFRALVAVNGLAANVPAEAIYIVAQYDSSLTMLNGAHAYVIHFPAGQLPPAKYFWSLTMYNTNLYLVPNPGNRYAIGNRTPGLKRNPDGSLDIYIQHSPPAGHASNWLPSPATGAFSVTLRLYGPKTSALNGTYVYPPIMRTG